MNKELKIAKSNARLYCIMMIIALLMVIGMGWKIDRLNAQLSELYSEKSCQVDTNSQ